MSFQEAIKNKNWKNSMDEEIKTIKKNDTWELISLPKGHKAIGMKWVFKAKKNAKGEVERYKARKKAIIIELASTMMRNLLPLLD